MTKRPFFFFNYFSSRFSLSFPLPTQEHDLLKKKKVFRFFFL